VRKAMTILSVVALGLAGTAWAGEKKDDKESKDSKVARAMAVAQIDFDLHRAQLGLIGSTLMSEGHAKPEKARPAAGAKSAFDATSVPVVAPVAPGAITEPRP
jgi:hypothetical protein